ncbi:hypothetical protein OROHE_026213 [Orobanche hederae]
MTYKQQQKVTYHSFSPFYSALFFAISFSSPPLQRRSPLNLRPPKKTTEGDLSFFLVPFTSALFFEISPLRRRSALPSTFGRFPPQRSAGLLFALLKIKPEDLIANFKDLKREYEKKLQNGCRSKKHERIKKKSLTVESELSLDNILESRGEDAQNEINQVSSGDEDCSKGMKTDSKLEDLANFEGLEKANMKRKSKTEMNKSKRKSKRHGKIHRKSRPEESELSLDNLLESRGEDAQDEIYQMSSGDEDYSKGMKKWITQYRQSRPGLKLLQERIDDFIMAHEAQEEKARVEREAQAAEGGWTVVVHHKGRKKTAEAETGVVVGSAAQAAVMDKMAKKKTKEVGIDFYRFQKREAHKNDHDAAKQIRTG